MTYLPDVNVWIALVVATHVHRQAAWSWFNEAVEDTILFCRVTQMGFLRLLTNPHVMGGAPLTAEEAWKVLRGVCDDERIRFVPEPAGLEEAWRKNTKGQKGPNFWTDAYLGAFASAAGYKLVTFDRAFLNQKSVPVKLLSSR